MMMTRHAMTLLLMAVVVGCGSDPSRPGPPGDSTGNHLVIEGRPSSVLLELTGTGIGEITSTSYTRSFREGNVVTVLLVGTDLDGSVGRVALPEGAPAASVSVRVVEAANAQNQVMPHGSVTARIHVGAWPVVP